MWGDAWEHEMRIKGNSIYTYSYITTCIQARKRSCSLAKNSDNSTTGIRKVINSILCHYAINNDNIKLGNEIISKDLSSLYCEFIFFPPDSIF